MTTPSTKPRSRQVSKKKTKGQFQSEAEFLTFEKQRFEVVFGKINWDEFKNVSDSK